MKHLICSLLLIASASFAVAKPYVGASFGYLIDSEESMISGHIGYNLASGTGATHGIELEVGETSFREEIFKASITPILANYRFAVPFGSRFDFFGGLGLGLSEVRVSGRGFATGIRDSDSGFTAQAFAGFAFNVTPKVSFTVGARHFRIGDVELFDVEDTLGDDTSIEAGIRIRF
jgi:opacity protein-like surface antigen